MTRGARSGDTDTIPPKGTRNHSIETPSSDSTLAGQDLPGHLGRGRQLEQVVEHADEEDDGGPEQDPERLRVVRGTRGRTAGPRGGDQAGQQAAVHGHPAEGRRGRAVDPALAGHHGPHAHGQAPHQGRRHHWRRQHEEGYFLGFDVARRRAAVRPDRAVLVERGGGDEIAGVASFGPVDARVAVARLRNDEVAEEDGELALLPVEQVTACGRRRAGELGQVDRLERAVADQRPDGLPLLYEVGLRHLPGAKKQTNARVRELIERTDAFERGASVRARYQSYE